MPTGANDLSEMLRAVWGQEYIHPNQAEHRRIVRAMKRLSVAKRSDAHLLAIEEDICRF